MGRWPKKEPVETAKEARLSEEVVGKDKEDTTNIVAEVAENEPDEENEVDNGTPNPETEEEARNDPNYKSISPVPVEVHDHSASQKEVEIKTLHVAETNDNVAEEKGISQGLDNFDNKEGSQIPNSEATINQHDHTEAEKLAPEMNVNDGDIKSAEEVAEVFNDGIDKVLTDEEGEIVSQLDEKHLDLNPSDESIKFPKLDDSNPISDADKSEMDNLYDKLEDSSDLSEELTQDPNHELKDVAGIEVNLDEPSFTSEKNPKLLAELAKRSKQTNTDTPSGFEAELARRQGKTPAGNFHAELLRRQNSNR